MVRSSTRSFFRVTSELLKNHPSHHAFSDVEPQHSSRDFTDRIERFDDSAIQPKMVVPLGQPRIEQGDQIARRSNRCDIRALVSIADQTRIRKIVRDRLTTMLPADNVINLMRESSVVLMKQAIFTSEYRPLNYLSA